MGFAFSIGHGAVGGSRLRKTLLRHFGVSPGEIATAGRQFPITARVDIQSALEDLFKPRTGTKLLRILSPNQHEVPALANTLGGTKGVSGAFIKELMRQCAQFQIESSHGNVLTQSAVDAAIEEMLFTGGALNRRLLGGEGAVEIPSQATRLSSKGLSANLTATRRSQVGE